jgi:predicted nucleic acid-binding Zn ribbon protein
MSKQQEINMNVALKDTTAITCEECQSEVFKEGVLLRKISRFVTGTAQDALMPIPVFACIKCGHVNAEFMPKDK